MSNTDIFHLVRNNAHLEILQLEGGVDLSIKNSEGLTPLHVAVMQQHIRCTELLIQKGAQIDARDFRGRTGLHIACSNACIGVGLDMWSNIIVTLLNHQADINVKDNRGETPIHIAARGPSQILRLVLQPQTSNPNIISRTGESPLSILCHELEKRIPGFQSGGRLKLTEHEAEEIVTKFRLLLSKGANPNFDISLQLNDTKSNTTPLGFAVNAILFITKLEGKDLSLEAEIRQLLLMCYQIAKELLDYNADVEDRFESRRRDSLLSVIVGNEIQLLIQHPKVKEKLDAKWGPHFSLPNSGGSDPFGEFKRETLSEWAYGHLRSRRTKWMMSACYYLFFLILFTVVTIHHTSNSGLGHFYFTQSLKDHFITEEFDDVLTKEAFWGWSQDIFLPKLFSDNGSNLVSPYDTVINPVILRQLRANSVDCSIDSQLDVLVDRCTPSWSESNEQTDSPFKGTNLDDAFLYTKPESGKFSGPSGRRYHGDGGYIQFLNVNSSYDLEALSTLQQEEWLDSFTSVAIIEFTVFNGNIDRFCAVRITVEFLPNGKVLPSSSFEAFELFSAQWSDIVVIDILFVLVLFSLVIKETVQILKNHRLYTRDIWNYLDLIVLGGATAFVISHILVIYYSSYLDFDSDKNQYADFQVIVRMMKAQSILAALFLLVCWIRIVGYIRIFKQYGILMRIIKRMILDVALFLTLFLIFLIGFALAFHILLGSELDAFKSWDSSFMTLFRWSSGEFGDEVFEFNDPLVSLLFFTFILFSAILLLNLLIAMLNQSYTQIIQQATAEFYSERAAIILSYGDTGANKRKYFRVGDEEEPSDEMELSTVKIEGESKFISKGQRKVEYPYSSSNQSGIIEGLGGQVTVLSSSIARGKSDDFIKKENVHVWTKNVPFSWFAVDFGEGKTIHPTHYTLKYASGGNFCCPRNWELQASNDPECLKDLNVDSWTTLRKHTDDTTFDSEFASQTWRCSPTMERYRFFRILQTGKNKFVVDQKKEDAWSHVLVAGGFELFGTLIDTNFNKEEVVPTGEGTDAKNIFVYDQANDAPHGLVSYLGPDQVKVFSSSVNSSKKVRDFISHEKVQVWTKNLPNSWFAVDIGKGRRIVPNHYALQYASGGNFCCPRNWLFQGSNHASALASDEVEGDKWTTLMKHENDTSLDSDWARKTWSVNSDTGYRYFRLIQTGPNKYEVAKGAADEWSNVFVANGFEVYGNLSDQGTATRTDNSKTFEIKEKIPYNPEIEKNVGIIQSLGGFPTVQVTASNIAPGKFEEDFISKLDVYCWTTNDPNSWFVVDLGADVMVSPTNYTMKYGSSGNVCCPRNWELQGTNTEDFRKAQWDSLSIHKDDESLDREWAVHTWAVSTPGKYRFFRIIQTGKNNYVKVKGADDGWGDVLVGTGFELFGDLYRRSTHEEQQTDGKEQKRKEIVTANYSEDSESSGAITVVGGEEFVKLYCSSLAEGKKLSHFISTENVYCWTTNAPNQWFAIDFGKDTKVKVSHYVLGYGSSGNLCCPRNWLLQGSNNLDDLYSTVDPTKDDKWVTLSSHTNDQTLDSDWAKHVWQVTPVEQAFRVFRIIQIGKNKYTVPQIGQADAWGDVLVANAFDVFGEIHSCVEPDKKKLATSSNLKKSVTLRRSELNASVDSLKDTGMDGNLRLELERQRKETVKQVADLLAEHLGEMEKRIDKRLELLETDSTATKKNLQEDLKRLEKRLPLSDYDFLYHE